jgi:glycerophosphoryl diester phosphodiesterase
VHRDERHLLTERAAEATVGAVRTDASEANPGYPKPAPARSLHSDLVERLRPSGLSVTTGTVNDAALVARAAALGVDAITTDRPGALHHELAAMSLEG